MKKYFFMAALLLSTGVFFAFTSSDARETNAKPLTQQWYVFNGGNEALPQNYSLKSTQDPPSCEGEDFTCAVKAVAHPTLTGKPDLADPAIIEERED